VSKAESVLTRLARANVWGGTIAAWGGFLAAGSVGIKHAVELIRGSGNTGMEIGSATILSGSGMVVYGSASLGSHGARGLFHIILKKSHDVTWKSVNAGMMQLGGTSVFRGMNAWLWAGTILVLVGEYIHNRFTRSDLQAWCEKSQWGNESKGWEADEQRYELAKLTYRPELSVMAEREALNQQFRYCAIELSLPGISKLSADNAEWILLEKRGTEWHAATGEWSETFLALGNSEDGVKLRASLLFDELESVNGLYLAVRFKPDGVSDWLPGSGKAFHARLALHEHGNVPHVPANSEKAWQPLKIAEEPEENITPLLVGYKTVLPEESEA
jgi:hypothetical protein